MWKKISHDGKRYVKDPVSITVKIAEYIHGTEFPGPCKSGRREWLEHREWSGTHCLNGLVHFALYIIV